MRERRQVCVRPLHLAGRVYKLGEMNTSEPMWAPDGKTLYHRAGTWGKKFMAVPVNTSPRFSFAEPRRIFEGCYYEKSWWWSSYCVASDGTIIAIDKEPLELPDKLHVVLNWFEELAAKMSSAKESQLQAGLVGRQ